MSNGYLKSDSIKKNPYLRGFFLYLLLFLIAFCFLLFLQPEAKLADPDSFYHAKMALLLKEQGGFKTFPWLQFTVLKDNFADHHFLYHVLLAPLVHFFHPLWAIKLTALVLASLLILLIYYFLRSFKIKGAFFYCLFLLSVNAFVFRISLAKAPVLSIIFLLLILLTLFEAKKIWLFLLSFLYVWAYGGWPLGLVVVFVYCLVRGLREKRLFKWPNWQEAGLVSAGLLAGIVINPYFPQNLKFYWQQIWQIGFLNYGSQISVGTEWYPYVLKDLVSDLVFLSLLFILASSLYIFSFKKQRQAAHLLFWLCLIFLFLTLKSRRNIEYLVPLAVMFAAFVFNNQTVKEQLKRIFFGEQSLLGNHILKAYLICFLLASFATIFYLDVVGLKMSFSQSFAFDKWQGASNYLLRNSKPGEVVFTSDWDEFPILFYHNSQNYYISGLDPTFMYFYDQDLHQKYVDITSGKQKEGLRDIIKEEFRASYVFIDDSHQKMRENIDLLTGLKAVYEDQQSVIYQVLD